MNANEPTEADYYVTLDENLQEGAYDHVSNQGEYARFRAALMRWVEAQDAIWDDIARREELGEDTCP